MLLLPTLFACSPGVTYVTNEFNTYEIAESDTADTAEAEDIYEYAPEPTVLPEDMAIDIWNVDGNVIYLAVNAEQVTEANDNWMNDSWGWGGYMYEIGETADVTTVEDLIAVDIASCDDAQDFASCDVASYGQVEFHVAGQSTGVAWEEMTIPNIAIDMDEIQDDLTLGGTEYLRFNNGQVGSIFREAITLEIFSRLGYAAPETSFTWLMSNVWPSGTRVPYTTVQPYKRDWCEANAPRLGGGCVNMWEGVGDLTTDWIASIGDECQVSECSNTRLNEMSSVVTDALGASNFKELTAPYLDWDKIHTQMCIDWILWVGDDYYHNGNNVVVVEQADGKFSMLPYSTDISLGQMWYQDVSLYGWTSLPLGCEYDPTCWADQIKTCEAVIDEFQALNPVGIVNDVYLRVAESGMLRSGDDSEYATITNWMTTRSTEGVLESELEMYRASFAPDCGDSGATDSGLAIHQMGGGGIDTSGNPCD